MYVCACVRACTYIHTYTYTSLHKYISDTDTHTHIPKTEPNHRVQNRTQQPPTLLGGCSQEPVTCLGPWHARSGQPPVTKIKVYIHVRIPKNQCPSISTIQSYLCNVSRSVTRTVRSAACYKTKYFEKSVPQYIYHTKLRSRSGQPPVTRKIHTYMYEFRKISALVYRLYKSNWFDVFRKFSPMCCPV